MENIGHNNAPCDDPNPTYYLAANPKMTMKLSEICHDMGMRAYFDGKGLGEEYARDKYYAAYKAELAKHSPNHPHLQYL